MGLEEVLVQHPGRDAACAAPAGAAAAAEAPPSDGSARAPAPLHAAAEGARALLLSPNLQLALQLASGALIVPLFTWIPALRFPGACFSWTIFLVTSVMMSPNPHVGTRLRAVCGFLGDTCVGLLVAGVLCTLAKLIGPAATHGPALLALYCTAGPALLALLVINRVATAPPMLWGSGMNTLLIFGQLVISGYNVWPLEAWWHHTVALLLLSGVGLACASNLVVSLLVAPTLASDQVRLGLAGALRQAGQCASRNAARLLCPPGAMPGCGQSRFFYLGTQAVELLPGVVVPDDSKDDVALVIRYLTAKAASRTPLPRPPAGAPPPGGGPAPAPAGAAAGRACAQGAPGGPGAQTACAIDAVGPPLYSVAPQLRAVQMLMPAAAAEPGCLLPRRFCARDFGALLAAAKRAVSSLTACESVFEDDTLINEASHMPEYVTALRLSHATVAAALARAAAALEASVSPDPAPPRSWRRARLHDGKPAGLAAVAAAGAVPAAAWGELRERLRAGLRAEETAYWEALQSGTGDAPAKAWSLTHTRCVMFSYSAAQEALDAAEALQTAALRALAPVPCPPAPGARGGCSCCGCAPRCAWAKGLADQLIGRDLYSNWRDALTVRLPAGLSSRQGFLKMVSGRSFQAGAKIWAVVTSLLVACLMVLHYAPALVQGQEVNLLQAYMAAVLSMSERTEATASKVASWLVASTLGGCVGFGLMAHPAVASNPYALAAALCACAFAVGLLGSSQFRVTITLALMMVGAEVLCQHKPCCAAGGPLDVPQYKSAVAFFGARVTSVCIGVLLGALVSCLVAPWFTSGWALETMAGALEAAAALAASGYNKLYDDVVEILAERDGRALAPQLPPPGPPQPPAGAPPAGRNQADAAPAPAPPAARAGGMAPAARVGSGAPASRASSGAFSLALLDPTDSFLDEGGSLDGVAAAAAVRGGPEGGAAGAAAGEGAKGAASGGSGADLARRVEAFVRADTAAASEALLRAPRFEEYETALRGRFAAPLAAVQASLIRDTTLWQRGVLSTPAVVPHMLHAMLNLLGPLEAMHAALRPPDLTGRFVGESWRYLVVDMHAMNSVVLVSLARVAAAVSDVVRRPGPEAEERLKQQIDDIMRRRVAARAASSRARAAFHTHVLAMGGDAWREASNIDDAVRALGFQHAWVHSFDRALGVARVVLLSECRPRASVAGVLK